MKRIAILRPEPGASATFARAEALGLDAIKCPLFETVSLDWTAPDPTAFDAILFTSANAPRLGGTGLRALRSLPAYCVGPTTAAAAEAAGFQVAGTGERGVADLLGALPPTLRLLHLCGRDRTGVSSEHRLTAIPVYAARALDPVSEPLTDVVALVHSPRAGRRLDELLGPERATIAIAAISPAAAASAGNGWRVVRSAASPEDTALLALAAQLCQTGDEKE